MHVWNKHQAIKLVLAAAVLIQAWIVATQFVLPLRLRIRTVHDLPQLERGAHLGFGDDFAQFMEFLRESVPEDAAVVVPSMSMDDVYGNSALMQYFLYPRSINQCNGGELLADCARRHIGDDEYMLSTSRYQAGDLEDFAGRQWIPFKGEFGVYAPGS